MSCRSISSSGRYDVVSTTIAVFDSGAIRVACISVALANYDEHRPMGKTLVTGATGFIGSHLARALAERGDELRILARRSSEPRRRSRGSSSSVRPAT